MGSVCRRGKYKVTGTLQVKRGKYFCVLDYRDENGARKFKWISTGLEEKGNKRKATEMLNKVLMEYELKNLEVKTTGKQNNHSVKIVDEPNQGDILFTDYMQNWLEKKKNKVETITWEATKHKLIVISFHILKRKISKYLRLDQNIYLNFMNLNLVQVDTMEKDSLHEV